MNKRLKRCENKKHLFFVPYNCQKLKTKQTKLWHFLIKQKQLQ